MINSPSPARKPDDRTPNTGALLAWYDRHRRALPWRSLPGETPDPYRVWLSEIMLQQTTVRAVKPYFERFLALFPTVADLAAAPADAVMRAWAGLGYYSRARNLHACAKAVVESHGGHFPPDEAQLRTLPGIGAYTAAAIAAIAFDRRAVVVDGNVERVVTRLHTVEEVLPRAKPLIRDLADALTPDRRPGDFAQAMMDLGATICTPKSPACGLCPWRESCRARIEGTQETYPRKEKKSGGALRRGSAFVAVRADGHVLLRTRPPRGLLGGMAETPTTEWNAGHDPAAALAQAPVPGAWRRLPGQVEHVFTHFPLALTVFRAEVAPGTQPPEGCRWVPLGELDSEALPNLMRKVLTHALER
ncbi:MAG: A/G-specific adenine glycosylase [Alsobacter sp.]